MSKHPEKFIKDKELFKELSKEKEIKESKEHKEKEFKEHKDKPEKEHKEKDIKEHKDKPEKEIKEIIKDYKEVKEIEKIQKDKDIEKIQKDKDKDAETQQPTGDPVEAFSLHKFHGKEHIEKVQKDVDKIHKDKEFEAAAQLVSMQPNLQKLNKEIFKEIHKDIVQEKHFSKEIKDIKDVKDVEVVGPAKVGPGDPVEQRLAVLESALAQLIHFIPAELRPDLSTGALAEEKRAQGAKTAADKPAKDTSAADKDKSDKK
jgi:hypothetical protein